MQMDVKNYIRNDIRWSVRGISADTLNEILDSIDENKHCEIIRNGYDKKVIRYAQNHGSFYIKRYSVRNGLESLKSIFSLSKAQREWNCGHRLLRNNLLAAEPVAVGEKKRFGMLKDCHIISKEIPNCTTVKECLTTFQQSIANLPKKNIVLKNLISYVKAVHDHGIFHGELHAENILVDTNEGTLFYLLDLGRAVFKKKPPLSLRIRELARLFYSLMNICTNEEITGLIHDYASQLLAAGDRKIFSKAVLKEMYRIKHRLWRSRTKKCLKSNNVFKAIAHARYTVNMRNEWDVDTLTDLINRHMRSFTERPGTIIKTSPKTGITRTPVSHENTKSVCIKEYRYPSALKRFLYSFLSSPARRAWLAAHGLMAAHFLTPKPIALFEERRAGILKKSFILMEDIAACLPCNNYVSKAFRDPYHKATAGKRRRFIACLALSFRQLHDSGVYHRDLKANNILVRELQDTWAFFYLDLDRVSFNKEITRKKRIKNLSQLNASIPNCITYTDRLRFYRIYTGTKNLDGKNKRIVQAIVQLSIQRRHVWNPKAPTTQILHISI